MSRFPLAQYAPKKLFTPISLMDHNKNFRRPIYKPSPLSSNAFNNRPNINLGGRNDFIPTSLTVPHANQSIAPMVPNNPINIVNFLFYFLIMIKLKAIFICFISLYIHSNDLFYSLN